MYVKVMIEGIDWPKKPHPKNGQHDSMDGSPGVNEGESEVSIISLLFGFACSVAYPEVPDAMIESSCELSPSCINENKHCISC